MELKKDDSMELSATSGYHSSVDALRKKKRVIRSRVA